MKTDTKEALTQFAMEMMGVHKDIRLGKKKYPYARTWRGRKGLYWIEVMTRNKNPLKFAFDSNGVLVKQSIG